MRKDRLLPGPMNYRMLSWRPPWRGSGLRPRARDYQNVHDAYWWSLTATAVLVSLYQFFSILPAGRALTRTVLGIFVVFAAGYAFVAVLARVAGALLASLGMYKSVKDTELVFMAEGPWIAATALAAVATSTVWVPALVGMAAVAFLIGNMARTLGISRWQAAFVVGIELGPLLALGLFWSWSMGWNFTPFY